MPLADIYGRKPVLVFSTLLTPVVIGALVLFTTSLDQIYLWIILLSLSYSSRGSAAFIMAQEFTSKERAIHLAAAFFIFDGVAAVACSFVFYTTKSQTVYISFLAETLAVLLIIFWVVCPESPKFLYEKRRYSELEKALKIVAVWNGQSLKSEIEFEI